MFLDGHGDNQKHTEVLFLSPWAIAQDLELSACQPRRAAGISLCTETGRQPAPGDARPKPGLLTPHSPLTTWRVAQERDPRPSFRVPVAVPVLLLNVCVALDGPPSSCPSVSSQSCYGQRKNLVPCLPSSVYTTQNKDPV